MPAKPAASPFHLNPCRLNFVAQFRSTEETRYYLNGVHVEPHPKGGVVMVATDGLRLAIAHDPDGACSEHVIIRPHPTIFKPRASLRDIMHVEFERIAGLGANQLLATRRDSKGEADQAAIVDLIDGTFPDWRRVVPWDLFDAENHFSGTFNADLLKTFGARFNGARPFFAIRQKSERDPALIYRSDLPWFLGVLMPAHGSRAISNELRALAPRSKAA